MQTWQLSRHADWQGQILVYIYGRVRFDLVVQMDFSFNVCPLVTNLMVVSVIVTRGRLQGDGGGSRDQVLCVLGLSFVQI